MYARLDLRLLPAAVLCWLAAVVALNSAVTAWATAAILVIAGSVCAACGRGFVSPQVRALCVALAAAMGIAAGVAASVSVRVHDRERATIADFDGAGTVEVVVEVDEWPRQRSSPDGHFDTSRSLVPGTAVAVAGDWPRAVHGGVVLLGATIDVGRLVPGERVAVRARVLRSSRPGLVSAVLVSSGEPRVLTRAPPYFRGAASVRQSFTAAAAQALPADAAGLLPALVLGDESATLPTVRGDFEDSGLTHLTAVSGANFAIVALCVLGLCTVVGLPLTARAWVTVVAIVGFVALVGPTGSVVRAAVMGLVGVAALALRRGSQPFVALLAAIVVLMVVRPVMARDVGFALSVAATAGLVLWAPVLRDRLVLWRVPNTVASLVAMTVVAQVVTLPLVVAVSGRFPLGGLVANLLAGPVIPIVTVVGTVASVVAPAAPLLAELGARVTGPELWWVITVARWCARVPVIPVPGGAVIGVAAAVLGVAFARLWRVRRKGRCRALSRERRDAVDL